MKMFRRTSCFAILIQCVILFGISGCSTIKHAYDGNEQPKESLAFVSGYNEQSWGKMQGLYIVGVDGKAFPHINEYPYAVYLLPGTHDLTIRYWNAVGNRAFDANQGLLITVEANHTYKIKHEVNFKTGPTIHIWIEDEQGAKISTAIEPSVKPTSYGWTKLH